MRHSIGALVGCAVLACLTSAAPGQPGDGKKDDKADKPRDSTIKDVYKKHFLIGTAGDLPGNYSDEELALVKDNFNVVTPENCMKPDPVHPSKDTWKFERPDALMKWCADNRIAVHGHTLVWHSQTNDWFFRDGDKDAVTQRIKDHISTLVGRYKGKIQGWDVVNEAISDGGDAKTAKTENLRNSPWLKALGPDFIPLAFKFAHEADPDAKLYYNDYGIEAGPKHESSVVLLKRLIKDGVPIHGVGIQGHWSTARIPYEALDKAIDDYAKLGLKVSITGAGRDDPRASGASSGGGRGRGQATFGGGSQGPGGRLCPVVRDLHQTQGRGGTRDLLGFSDWPHVGKASGQHPLIFDSKNQRKPAYGAIVDALLQPKP